VAALETFRAGSWVRADEVTAGQIGRLHGLVGVRVGDGFGAAATAEEHRFPPPTLEASVRAVRADQGPGLRAALAELADQDPLIDVRAGDDGRLTVSLYGRVQQEVLAATLAEEHGIEVEFADAGVLHVERPRRVGMAVERFNTPTNPYHATVGLRVTPTAPGSGLGVDLAVPGRDLPLFLYKSADTFASVLERHVARTLEHGLLGWPVTDCRVTLTEVGYTSMDGPPSRRGPLPTALDYRRLIPFVLRQALARAGTVACEPVLQVDLDVPTADAAAVQRLLTRWGAELTGQAAAGEETRIGARLVALKLHELQRQLPDLTGGEGVLESRFAGYLPVREGRPVRPGWSRAAADLAVTAVAP
jgi:ribosomal protection tetracycline resistance protein